MAGLSNRSTDRCNDHLRMEATMNRLLHHAACLAMCIAICMLLLSGLAVPTSSVFADDSAPIITGCPCNMHCNNPNNPCTGVDCAGGCNTPDAVCTGNNPPVTC